MVRLAGPRKGCSSWIILYSAPLASSPGVACIPGPCPDSGNRRQAGGHAGEHARPAPGPVLLRLCGVHERADRMPPGARLGILGMPRPLAGRGFRVRGELGPNPGCALPGHEAGSGKSVEGSGGGSTLEHFTVGNSDSALARAENCLLPPGMPGWRPWGRRGDRKSPAGSI